MKTLLLSAAALVFFSSGCASVSGPSNHTLTSRPSPYGIRASYSRAGSDAPAAGAERGSRRGASAHDALDKARAAREY